MMGKMEIRSPPGSRPRDGRHCDLCGCSQPAVRCDKCGCQIFCLSCDDMYHRHPKRRFHLRKAVDPIPSVPQARPVLPMKVSQLNATNPGDPSKMPLPPPRKKKSSIFGSFRKPSPSDNSPPLPKKEYSWTDRLGSIKKFMSNRPLPPLPTSDDTDGEQQPTTNGQSNRGDLSFIHRRNEERPPQLPQRSPKTPEFPGQNQEKENRIPSSQAAMHGQMRNGSLEQNTNHVNQNQEFLNNEANHWNNKMNNQNGTQAFGTLNRQRDFMPPGAPGYPGTMHQSSSATDLHSMHNAEGMPAAGPVPPHYPHYPMNPHMPPHYPYPMYHPQFPNYPQYFGNSFGNLSHPPTSENDMSDSESASRHSSSSKKHQFRKRAKRSQSVMVDRMGYPGQFYPFGPYPGYGPWGAPMPMEAPPSPASSVRSLTRAGRSKARRKKMTSEEDDEELSVSSSPMSRPKSSSSDPKEHPRAPLATQTTSSEDESDENIIRRRNKSSTIRRQSEPVPSPVRETTNAAKIKQSSSKQSDSEFADARGTPEMRRDPTPRSEKRPSIDSTTDSPQPAQQKSSTQIVPPDAWECKHCTYVNPIGNRICQVCCKTATPRTETPVSGHSRPSSAAAANSRKQSIGSEKECSSPDKAPDYQGGTEKKDRQDMASLNSALDEAEKQISKGLEELMKLKDDIDANISKEKPKQFENQPQPEAQEASKPVYKSSGKMRTSILDKLNLSKPQSSTNTSVSTSTETQTGQNNWTADKIIEARRHSNSSTTSETYNSPLAQSPDLDGGGPVTKGQKRDSSCQTHQDSINEYLEKRKAAEEAFLGRPINNFGFGYNDRMDMMTSPAPSMYDRFYGGGFGMMQRSHSRASLFAGRVNEFGPMDYGGGPGFGYGPGPMYRSVSRGSLTGGEYPGERMSEFHNLRKPDYYLSMEELVERRRQDNIRAQGLELVRMIREAEQQGFNADDIQVALTHCGKQNPMEWLQENWRNMVDSVLTLSTNYGNDKKENDIGLLSENEARDALRLHKGNIWAAVTECVEGRQRKYLQISARGNFPRQDIVDALTASDGDVEMAYAKLTKSTGRPFHLRIWGAGEGAQNQDGAQPIPEDFHDAPRMYLKDEALNSDEMSEELWSEDGEWDDEEVYEEEEERVDFEDLQTCHEDLQTSPQEMLTPESDDRSEYCDAIPMDDRNASSPSDDIFFVIPEAKPEKKKGFLSKLTALRRDSKEQANAASSPPEGYTAQEQKSQAKEDTISQKSNSSTEHSKNNGALSSLKNTLSAIKDTVTGGSKSEKKVPVAQPERRTIIVKGQMEHESLSNDSSNVQLTSMKPLIEDVVINEEPLNEYKEQPKTINNLQEIKAEQTNITKSEKSNLTDSNQLQSDKARADFPSTQTESKSKTENKKSQSLAERLKFAKMTRNANSTLDIAKESSSLDTKIHDNMGIEDQKKESVASNQTISSDVLKKSEIKLESERENNVQDTGESRKEINKIPDVANNIKQIKPAGNAGKTQDKDFTPSEEFPVSASPSKESQSVKKDASQKVLSTSSKKIDSNQLKQINQTEPGTSKSYEEVTNKPVSDIRPPSVSPTAKTSNKDKFVGNNLKSDSTKETSRSNSSENLKETKQVGEQKSDMLKANFVVSDNKMSGEKQTTVQTPASSSSVENISVNLSKQDSKESALKDFTNKTDKPEAQTGNSHLERTDTKINIPQTVRKQSEVQTASENLKSNPPQTLTSQSFLPSDPLIKENKSEELNSVMVEKQEINNSEDETKTIDVQNALTGEVSHSKLSSITFEEVSKNKSEVARESELKSKETGEPDIKTSEVLTQSEMKPDDADTDLYQKGKNSLDVSTKSIPKSKASSEDISASPSNELIEHLPTTASDQGISAHLLQQTPTDNSKTQTDFNSSFLEGKILTPQDASELHNLQTIKTYKQSTVNALSGELPGSFLTSVQESKSTDSNLSTKPTQNIAATVSSMEATLNKDIIPTLPGENDYPSTSAGEVKTGKIKGTKVSKIKKSQESGKNASKEKTGTLECSQTSENISAPVEEGDKIVNSQNTSSERETSLSNETTSEPIKDKILVEETSKGKVIENKENPEANIPQTEEKIDTLEINIKPTDEDTVQTSEENKSSENANILPEPTQSAAVKTEFQNDTLALNASIPSTSKVQEIGEPTKLSETEKTVETTQNSSEIHKSSYSTEVELQKGDVSNKVNENTVIVDAPTTSDDVLKDSVKGQVTSETDTDNFKMMPPVSSTTFPDKSKMAAVSSSIIVPDNSKMVEATSNITVLDNSNSITTSSNVIVSDNSLTTTSATMILDNSKATEASSNATVHGDSNAVVAAKITSTLNSSNETEPSTSTVIPDASNTAPTTKTTSVVNNSTTAEPSTSSAIPDASNSVADTTTTAIINNSKPSEPSTSSAISDASKSAAAAKITSKILELSTGATTSNNSNASSDTKFFSVQKQDEQHSKVTENATMAASLTDKLSSLASTASQSERETLKRTVSEDDSTSQAADSDDSEDESRPSSVTPPSPVDALRSRFEGLAGGTVRGAPGRPASPFRRRMSFNTKKQVIALEKQRDTSADKPWFHQKIVNEPVKKIPQPKRTIKQQLEMERKVRKMVADRKIRTYRKAEIVVQLMDMNFEEEEAIQAANECSTLEQAVSYLQQECLLCTGNFPVSQIISMTHCQHRACRECIRAYFTVQIRDRTILDLLCPFCNEPDIGDEDVAQDYFNHLDIMLKKLVDVEIHELFQRKLRDRVLMKDPNFRWCSQCSSGFISMPNLKRLICPDCNAITCAFCRRLWEREHQGISCEAFAALKDASDPEAQAAGLAKMLTEDGIDCPSCHFRYALAKGGCMHFRCIQCQHDFCSGCSRPFKMGQKCGVSEFCGKLGLHAHHPRNCLFYLRDKEPEDLQKLLDMNDIKYNREPPEGMELKSTCQVMEQKETADGMVDDFCGKEIQEGFAGLCRVHYVEYLGQLVNKYKVDPIQIFENDDLELVLRRANIRLPPKRYRENDVQYREKLVNLIQEELPLDKMDGS